MAILIMEYLTAFNAKINVMHVHQILIFVYLVTELIGFYGPQKIMIACKYNFI